MWILAEDYVLCSTWSSLNIERRKKSRLKVARWIEDRGDGRAHELCAVLTRNSQRFSCVQRVARTPRGLDRVVILGRGELTKLVLCKAQ